MNLFSACLILNERCAVIVSYCVVSFVSMESEEVCWMYSLALILYSSTIICSTRRARVWNNVIGPTFDCNMCSNCDTSVQSSLRSNDASVGRGGMMSNLRPLVIEADTEHSITNGNIVQCSLTITYIMSREDCLS